MRIPARALLPWAILGATVLVASIVLATLTGPTRPAGPGSLTAVTTPLAPARPSGAVSGAASGVVSGAVTAATPVPCCSSVSPATITVSGQGLVRGSGASARASAIGRAVADALGQAKAAASAAGTSLGQITSMQVSAPYYPCYPYPAAGTNSAVPGAAGTGSGTGMSGAAGASGAAAGTSSGPMGANAGGAASPGAGAAAVMPCFAGSPCSCPRPVITQASVTITWALGS